VRHDKALLQSPCLIIDAPWLLLMMMDRIRVGVAILKNCEHCCCNVKLHSQPLFLYDGWVRVEVRKWRFSRYPREREVNPPVCDFWTWGVLMMSQSSHSAFTVSPNWGLLDVSVISFLFPARCHHTLSVLHSLEMLVTYPASYHFPGTTPRARPRFPYQVNCEQNKEGDSTSCTFRRSIHTL